MCWTCDPPRWRGDRRRLLEALRRQREIYDAQRSQIGVYDLWPYTRKVGLDWLAHPDLAGAATASANQIR